MKHTIKITALLLLMFIITQFVGLYVVGYYSQQGKSLPFGIESPQPETASEYAGFFSYIIFAFMLAVLLLFLFTKFDLSVVLKIWFFVVIVLALSISLLAVIPLKTAAMILVFTIPLAALKVFGRNFIIHNLTELLVYPGIAAVFVPILNVYTVIGLLVIISIYDMWAVWHSGIMQKMAKYHIDNLKIFPGFFVPYLSDKLRSQIGKWKKTMTKRQLNRKKIRINVAILGGGDIVFPIIAAGVALKTNPFSSLFVVAGAVLGLTYLFFIAEKKKFYPAMPFITAGILLGWLLSYIIL